MAEDVLTVDKELREAVEDFRTVFAEWLEDSAPDYEVDRAARLVARLMMTRLPRG